jgi:hypothetical protein
MRRIFATLLLAGCATSPAPRAETTWYKGNLHTHSLWTDGADFPEMIAQWYKDHGYNFLAVTEHDILQSGEKWVDIAAPDVGIAAPDVGWPPRNESTRLALPAYRARFGDGWVQERREDQKHLIRLRALDEYRDKFEEPNRFMLIMSEEITDKQGAHVNAFNLERAILPRGGATTAERTRNNLAAVDSQRRIQTPPVIAIVNHPNYVWALKAEEIAAIPTARLFEVYNGHRMTNSEGDATHPGTERMWDVILSARHAKGEAPILGVATDDAHEYREYNDTISRPGRGWVMVRAARLTPDAILHAIAAGDFYASTGVTLRDVDSRNGRLRITIAAEPGVTYRTTFVGTRKNSREVGEILAEVDGVAAEYRFKGNERYVRAKVVSSRAHTDPIGGLLLGRQSAWVQPVFR